MQIAESERKIDGFEKAKKDLKNLQKLEKTY